jgi:hypothetical protein
MKTRTLTALSGLGLFAAATAWAVHQQADYVFASLACNHGVVLMSCATALALIILAAAASAAIRVPRSGEAAEREPDDVLRPRKFLASMSLLAVLLFLFAVFLQASATLFLPSCTG